jgi:hypothetical protein
MPVYTSSEQLYDVLKSLFYRIGSKYPEAEQSISKTKLLMRLRTTSPSAEVNFDGRLKPIRITYGPSTLRPDLEIELPMDILHMIMLSQMSAKQAIASGKFKMRGPVWKTFGLLEIFLAGQSIYSEILREQGIDGHQGESEARGTPK